MLRSILFTFFTLAATAISAQTPFSKEFWLNESNMPVKVNALMYEDEGYMWLGTEHGLYKFNGRTFTSIADSIRQPVTAIGVTGHMIYVGFKNGVVGVYNDGRVAELKIRGARPLSAITSLHINGPLLWITTQDEGVFVVVNGVGVQYSADDGLTDNFVYDALVGLKEVMLTTDRGINHLQWEGEKPVVKVFTTSHGLPDNIVRVMRPIAGTRTSWLGTQQGGVAIYDDTDQTFQNFRMSNQWAWGQVNDILPITGSTAWVATEEGYLLYIRRFDDSLDVMPYSYEGTKLKKLALDKTGNIWCATNKGLLMNTARYALDIRMGGTFSLSNVTAMICDRKGNLWYTQNKDLYRLPLNSPATPEKALTAEAAITCLYADEEDNLWFGTFGKGLFYYNGGGARAVHNIPELVNGHILSIASAKGKLWIASLNGVEETVVEKPFVGALRWVRHHNKLSGTGSDYIYQLYTDSKERMWMATDGGGVCMFENGKYHRWDTSSGLTSQVVYSITEDAGGSMWTGTLEKGIFRYQENRWKQITARDGLQGLNITAVRGNGSGHVVVVNDEGIDQWYPKSKQFRHYNRRLGIDIDSISSVLNCIANDTEGNVYVPFEHGFIKFLNQEAHYSINPTVEINTVKLFFKPLAERQKEFRPDENHISFGYSGINFSNPERLHYRYKLEGYEDSWIYTNDEDIPFAQLPAGDYVFRVQASLNNSFEVANEDSYAFSVSKPFWQTGWFIALASIAVMGLAVTLIRLREEGIKDKSRMQRERMVFEYEHLKSQVNPHFLFNSLNTLVNLIEEDQTAATDYTVRLADLYRNMLSFKDQDLIKLSEEFEIITNYMYIQKSRFGEALQLETRIPENVMRATKIVPLALQLLVENAIKHNVVSLARPLTIYITANGGEIMIKNSLQPKLSKEKGAGLGLMNIKKRYSLLTNRSVEYGVVGNEYIVILPLL